MKERYKCIWLSFASGQRAGVVGRLTVNAMKTFPVVLVRLSRVSPDAMRDLLGAAARAVLANQKKRRPASRRRVPTADA